MADLTDFKVGDAYQVRIVGVFNGAHMVRTHDVASTVEIVRQAEQIRKIVLQTQKIFIQLLVNLCAKRCLN